jgi:hypothetical protein
MCSPIVATASVTAFSTVLPSGSFAFSTFSSLPSVLSAAVATLRTRAWNCSLRETKSVSELSSTMAARLPPSATAIRPSAATRPAFFAALARPLVLSQSIAASMSPFVSVSAVLQSIMPAPVFSRSSFTICAVMAIRRSFQLV